MFDRVHHTVRHVGVGVTVKDEHVAGVYCNDLARVALRVNPFLSVRTVIRTHPLRAGSQSRTRAFKVETHFHVVA